MKLQQLEMLDEAIKQITPHDSVALLEFFEEFRKVIERLERDFTREEIIRHIPCIRSMAACSPLIKRAQKWPKGYQGDFETIEHILSQKNKALPGTVDM